MCKLLLIRPSIEYAKHVMSCKEEIQETATVSMGVRGLKMSVLFRNGLILKQG